LHALARDRPQEAIVLHRIEVRLARLLPSAPRLQPLGAEGSGLPLELGMSRGELALPDRRQPTEGQHRPGHARGHRRNQAGRAGAKLLGNT
jgi:hypothetical protein